MTGLDPDLAALIDQINARAVDIGADVDPKQLRANFGDLITFLRVATPTPFPGEITNTEMADVSVRVYRPSESADPGGVVVFLHGGGWVLGDLETAEPAARAIAEEAGFTTVSVDYRRAPEHPFPAALNDTMAVIRHLSASPDITWLAVAGDSAGGNLAAAAALTCASENIPLDAQLLIYPAVATEQDTGSHEHFGDGYLLTAEAIRYYWAAYAAGADPTDPRLAPAHATDVSGLPPTIVTTAGFDPLHDEGQAYAARLVAADIPTTYLPAPSLIHGWLDQTDRIPAARRARSQAIASLSALHDAARLS